MSEIGLIFDLDGIVIDSELKRDHITRELVESLGFQYGRDKLKPLMSGKPQIECMQILVDEYGLKIDAEDLTKLRQRRIIELYRDIVDFVPGFIEFYQSLVSQFNPPRAIATGLEEDLFILVDKRLKISNLFLGQVYHSGIGKSKPDPSVFLHAAGKIGVSPSNCVIFEDSLSGIIASREVGARTVVLTRTFSKEALLEKVNLFLDKPLEENKDILFISDYSTQSLEKVKSYLLQR